YIEPYTVSKIIYPDGTEKKLTPTKRQVMEDSTAFLITDMLRSVVDSGTGTLANISGVDVAGKTGTTNFDEETRDRHGFPSNATNDSWFVGYTPQYTAAVWTGYSEIKTSEDYLGKASANIPKLIF